MSDPRSAENRFLDLIATCLTRESAERLLSLQFDPHTRQRIAELAPKAESGELSEAERQEYEDHVEAMDLLGILQSKARRVLKTVR